MGLPDLIKGVCVLALLAAAPSVQADAEIRTAGIASNDKTGAAVPPKSVDVGASSIGSITINNGSIFDLEDPAEDKVLYRFANRAHVTTRPDVIEAQLLFESGDEFSPQVLAESERLLRANRYLQDVSITPVLLDDGVVDIEVTTTDVWTLIPKLDIARSGGENKSAFGIKEMNLLGTGIAVEIQHRSDVDRDSTSLRLINKNIGHSRYAVSTRLASNSDGHNAFLQLGKPFYSLNSRDAKGLRLINNDQVESFYDRGERLSDFRHEARQLDVFLGWSKGLHNGWTKRLSAGLAYDDHEFSATTNTDYPSLLVPENRSLVYPFVSVEWLQDKYEKASNYEQINIIEDRFLGTRISGRLGLASADAGSDRDAWILRAAVQKGFGSTSKNSLLLAAGLDTRLEAGSFENLSLGLSAKFYRRQSEHRLLYVSLAGTYGHRLDLDQHLLLGGDSGLRGYPLRYQAGDKKALITVEQRFFTEWYPFRLFHVGGAVFFDAGRAWGETPLQSSQNDWLRDVGFGLRLGQTRSGLGRMTHIDVAFPLDGDQDIADVQFLISTRKSF